MSSAVIGSPTFHPSSSPLSTVSIPDVQMSRASSIASLEPVEKAGKTSVLAALEHRQNAVQAGRIPPAAGPAASAKKRRVETAIDICSDEESVPAPSPESSPTTVYTEPATAPPRGTTAEEPAAAESKQEDPAIQDQHLIKASNPRHNNATVQHIPTDYSPLYVGAKTLKEARINDNREEALFVQLEVSSIFPNCPQTVDRLQYAYNPASKLRFVSSFLGGKEGLGIIAPAIPACVTLRSTTTPDLGASQLLWLQLLDRQVNKYAKVVTDPDGDAKLKLTACRELSELVDRAAAPFTENGKAYPAPFPRPLCVTEWKDILIQPSQIIVPKATTGQGQKDTVASPRQNHFHRYQLALYTNNATTAYIVACTMHQYSLLKETHPDVTSLLTGLLPAPVHSPSTDSTDEEQEWETQHSRHTRRQHKPAQRLKHLQSKIDEIASSPAYLAALPVYGSITKVPLLALAVKVSTRCMKYRYVSCVIDNFQSIGCDISNLARDPRFLEVMECRAEFRPPYARWSVNQRWGNSSASLLLREDHKELIANLNRYVAAAPELQQPPALRVAMTVARRNKHGKGVNHDTCTKIFLTPATRVMPPVQQRQETVALVSASQPPPENSWAARLSEGLRRRALSGPLPSGATIRPTVRATTTPPAPARETVRLTNSPPLPAAQLSPQQPATNSRAPVGIMTQYSTSTTPTTQTQQLHPSETLAKVASQVAQMEQNMSSMIQAQIRAMMEQMMNDMMNRMMVTMQQMVQQTMTAMMQQMMMPMSSMMQNVMTGGQQVMPAPSQPTYAATSTISTETHPACHDAAQALAGPAMPSQMWYQQQPLNTQAPVSYSIPHMQPFDPAALNPATRQMLIAPASPATNRPASSNGY